MQDKKSDKEGKVIESLKDNGGKRTVILGTVAAKGAAPPHYHEDYEETLEVVEGALSVWAGKSKIVLNPGQSITAKRRQVHYFKNETDQPVVMKVIIEPGNDGWEKNVAVSQGLSKDGFAEKLSKFSFANVPYYTFMMHYTNTVPVGGAKVMFSFLQFLHGRKKLKKYEEELISKYCQ